MEYSWLSFLQARQQLAARLADPTNQFWEDAENGAYIVEALRTHNALTFTWKTTFEFMIAAASSPQWLSLGTLVSSPRLRSVTDTALYTLMEYHLLEPPTGSVWTGTSQFSISDLQTALQRCRDEAIQFANTNQQNPALIPTTPGDTFINLPDNFLDVSRAQFVGTNDIVTLMRTDTTALNYYQTEYPQTPPALPSQYNMASLPPLQLQVDIAPAEEGAYDLIALIGPPAFDPPFASLLNVPDDCSYALKWGAMADLLSRESEATDLVRAKYAKQRYGDLLKVMSAQPWIMQSFINGKTADMVSFTEMDWRRPEWDSSEPDYQIIITGGIDFFTVVPDPSQPISVSLIVLGNAPIPAVDGDFIQCSRDVWDAILDYAQFLAAYKQGGEEFLSAMPLEANFYAQAMKINGRLEKLGLFANVYDSEGMREVRVQERFDPEE